MKRLSRRKFLGVGTAAVAAAAAGCTGAFDANLGTDEPEEFLVVSTDLVHSPGYRWDDATYPEDMVARIVVENQRPERGEGVLEATLRHEPPGGEPKQWEKSEPIEGGGGVAPTVILIFEDVYEDGNDFSDYEISAEVVEES